MLVFFCCRMYIHFCIFTKPHTKMAQLHYNCSCTVPILMFDDDEEDAGKEDNARSEPVGSQNKPIVSSSTNNRGKQTVMLKLVTGKSHYTRNKPPKSQIVPSKLVKFRTKLNFPSRDVLR